MTLVVEPRYTGRTVTVFAAFTLPTIYMGYLPKIENRDGLICIFLVIKKKMSLHAFSPETRYCHSALLAGRSAATQTDWTFEPYKVWLLEKLLDHSV